MRVRTSCRVATTPRPAPTLARAAVTCALIAATAGIAPTAAAASQQPASPLTVEIFRELIEIRSSENYPENTRRLLEGVVQRLKAAGFADNEIELSEAGRLNLVVRYRGTGSRKPLLAMAHVDVVDADPDSWRADPFTFVEADGYSWGRGTTDNKAGAASLIANFIRLRQEGYEPDRDLIMVLTGNEETTMDGIAHLAAERLDLIGAELAFNTDSGGGVLDPNGEPSTFMV